MSFDRWRSLVDGAEIDVGSDIPDSVVAQYDASAEDSTGSINTITDLIGTFDLSGSAAVIDNGINDLKTYRFDGSVTMSNSDINIGTPNVTIMVVQKQGSLSSSEGYYDVTGSTGNRRQLDERDSGSTYRLFHGESTAEGGTADGEPHIIEHHGNANGTNDRLVVDGAEVINADVGDGTIDEFELAFSNTSQREIDVGELIHYDDPTEDLISDEVGRLSEKWGITLS